MDWLNKKVRKYLQNSEESRTFAADFVILEQKLVQKM